MDIRKQIKYLKSTPTNKNKKKNNNKTIAITCDTEYIETCKQVKMAKGKISIIFTMMNMEFYGNNRTIIG